MKFTIEIMLSWSRKQIIKTTNVSNVGHARYKNMILHCYVRRRNHK
jgi:hypothetical protein